MSTANNSSSDADLLTGASLNIASGSVGAPVCLYKRMVLSAATTLYFNANLRSGSGAGSGVGLAPTSPGNSVISARRVG